MNSYIILAALWIGWCLVHSAMITLAATRRLERWMGGGFRVYRAFYNSVALVTLIPVLWYERSLDSPFLWGWTGPFAFARGALLAIAILWTSDLSGARLVTNLVLTAYLIVGTFLEERKLIAEYGDEYREYQKRVPMLLPFGFLTSWRKG